MEEVYARLLFVGGERWQFVYAEANANEVEMIHVGQLWPTRQRAVHKFIQWMYKVNDECDVGVIGKYLEQHATRRGTGVQWDINCFPCKYLKQTEHNT